jgi:malonate-semialdehyde dehydrogenase (acetylating)/methylmalonate-semialdehyde dehydrogenase
MVGSETLKNYVGGKWQDAAATETLPVHNPATGEVIAAAPLSGRADVEKAVHAASEALQKWRRTPPGDRIQPLFRSRRCSTRSSPTSPRLITSECGKTLAEAEGELRRGIENVEVATGIPSMMMGSNVEDIATGIDELMIRQPVGVVPSSRRSTSPE